MTIAPPEWVHVWMWMRSNDDARNLPQMLPPGVIPSELPNSFLTMAEYEVLRQQWIDAGAPKGAFRKVEPVESS